MAGLIPAHSRFDQRISPEAARRNNPKKLADSVLGYALVADLAIAELAMLPLVMPVVCKRPLVESMPVWAFLPKYGTVRNLVFEAILMKFEGASNGYREELIGPAACRA